jgi:hypothetical protein
VIIPIWSRCGLAKVSADPRASPMEAAAAAPCRDNDGCWLSSDER